MKRSLSPRATVFRVVRAGAGIGYVVAFVAAYRRWGFPFDREAIMLWIAGAVGALSIGRGRHWLGRFLRDWLPFAVLLAVYDLAYGVVEYFGLPVLVRPLVKVDQWMFGGEVPAVWLQQNIDHTGSIGWWEVGVAVVYASHFVVPLAMAGTLWWRSRERWRQWVAELLTVSFTAVAVYSVVPTGAPWYAAKLGLIPTLDRPVGRGWVKIGMHAAPQLLERGRLFTNQYAAVPSLHAGYSFLFALFIYRFIGRGRWRLAVFAYPIAMAFTLMYGGEHFAIDIIAGWALAAAARPIWGRLERRVVDWRSRRRQRRSGVLTSSETSDSFVPNVVKKSIAKVSRTPVNVGEPE